MKLFSNEHVWLETDGEDGANVIVGITPFAQDALGEVVSVELPEPGTVIARGAVAGMVESIKTASDVYAPASGVVTAVNEDLRADPGLANSAPLGAGWFFKLRLADAAELEGLMDEAAYAAFSE